MRILTILSGILLAGGGGFCYYFSTNAFASLAFVLGALMLTSGLFTFLTYLVGLRNPIKLPETVFVEGIVSMLFGFAVLNNQVSDPMLNTFFGTWLTLAGATRLSQSFSVSRHNARDWAKIVPLSVVSIIGGMVMLMHNLVEAYNPVALVGTAFLLDALSQLIYVLYMRPHTPKKRELAAKARADAKEDAKLQRRREKAEYRKLSREEKRALKEQRKAEKEAEAAAKKEAEAKAKAEAEASAVSSDTISLSPQQVDEIREKTDEAYGRELEKAEAEKAAAEEKAQEDAQPELRPVWHRPTDIPSLRGDAAPEEEDAEPELQPEPVTVVKAVNLEELEGEKEVEFEKVELPQPKYLAKGGEAAKREEFLKELDKAEQARVQGDSFTAVSLEELTSGENEASVSEDEIISLDKKLTTEFSFCWPKTAVRDDEK